MEVHDIKVVHVVAAEEEDQGPHHQLDRVACPVEVPDGRGCAEAHHVHPECHPCRSRKECGAVLRPSNRPLPVCMAKGDEVGVLLGHAPCQVDKVADGVMRSPWLRCVPNDASPRRVGA